LVALALDYEKLLFRVVVKYLASHVHPLTVSCGHSDQALHRLLERFPPHLNDLGNDFGLIIAIVKQTERQQTIDPLPVLLASFLDFKDRIEIREHLHIDLLERVRLEQVKYNSALLEVFYFPHRV
jgi:hypothetical protein